MRELFACLCLVVMSATPTVACDFKSANGSTIRFLGPEAHRYALIDGKRCSFTETAFTCGGSTRAYEGAPDETILYRGIKYTSTDDCRAGPE